MSNIFSFLKPYRFPMVIALLLMLVELMVELFHPLMLAKMIDDGIMQEDLSVVLRWGGIMLGMSFLAFVSGVVNSFYAAHVSQSTGFDIRSSLYQKVQSFSFRHLQRFQTSSLITRMTNDVNQIQTTIFMSLRIMLRAPLLVIGGVVMAFVVNIQLAMVLVVTIPIIIIFLVWMMRKGSTLFRQVQARLDEVNHAIRENLGAMRLIKVFVRRKHEGKRFLKRNEALMDSTVKALRVMEITMPALLLLMNVAIIGVLWFGSMNVNTGNAQIGEVVAIVNYGMRITSALTIFTMIIIIFSRARASAERITDVLNTEVDRTNLKKSNQGRPIKEGKIEFEEVSFYYPKSDEKVLDRCSFTVKPGQTLAILGSTGSGKSSLFHLIPRLYDVSEGTIFIDNVDSKEMKIEYLRQQIGYVPQEIMLFSGTVKENIAWGKTDATLTDIMEAAKDAQIHDAIMKLPHQYDTKIGQKGVNLSGGQKQRLSIARALIRKPKILMLDDSTSALDVQTEARLLKALGTYLCTTLLITQKLSTAMKADSILLLEEGKVVAQGSHGQLLSESPLYQQLYQSQFAKGDIQHAKVINGTFSL
ncbi:ABC transporter ATP-binding protein [Halalkalibacter nanhaiisediminis]|uniref:ATP-binding cassette subfamily B protein n=1 Tax=Halalkalibacter nanhaiisediminis TaxID=688079 RepID=A0A562QCT5_9BACI|nr:ABC transporter ATP-binding protein [Halalkalibacter nanhaiisediminis]TWI54523.1 ATP-binding cassette subfamily B protein [Halalkalibacter nanhaiisediminis]